jgi:pimeloyl-ACP methyl ester carboxylesterase
MRLFLRLLLLLVLVVVLLAVACWRRPMATMEVVGRGALRMYGFEKVSIPAPGGTITYFRAGSGSPMIFLHGANDQSGGWARVAPEFKASHRVIVADLAGHGESDPEEGRLSLRQLVGGVAAVVQAEGKDQPVIIVGNSLGGFLALVQAHRNPGTVSHAIIVNGAVDRGDGMHAAVTLLPKNREEAREAMDALTSPKTPRVPGFVLDDLARRSATSPLSRLMPALDTELGEYLLDDTLDRITIPVTMIWGADDRVLSVTYAQRAAEKLPNARLVTIPDCGHVPQRECAPQLLALMQEALARPGKDGGSR